jgi:hypothetical protein
VLQERGYTFSAFEVDRLQEAASIIQEIAKEPSHDGRSIIQP